MTEIYKAVLYTWQEKGFGQGLSPSVWAWGLEHNKELRELPIYIKPLIW
jgi:hypothetical protein